MIHLRSSSAYFILQMHFGGVQQLNHLLHELGASASARAKCYWTTSDYIRSWISFMHGLTIGRPRSCFRTSNWNAYDCEASKKWIKLLVHARGTLTHNSTIRFLHTAAAAATAEQYQFTTQLILFLDKIYRGNEKRKQNKQKIETDSKRKEPNEKTYTPF